MKQIWILLAALAVASADTLRVTTGCKGDICTTNQTIVAIEISVSNVNKTFSLTMTPGASQSGITFTPTVKGTWSGVVRLNPGRNELTVKTLGSAGTRIVYYQPDDGRASIVATGFFGVSLDSFASSSLNAYINPDQSGKIRERGIGGVAFEYRLLGERKRGKQAQLWVYGEATHGVRSAGIDCTADTSQGICVSFDPARPNRTLYLIRASTSLEAFLGVRWEMRSLQPLTDAPAAFYVKGQVGFLAIAGSGGDLNDIHHIAAGVIARAGRFTGSYLEMGLGRTALFPQKDSFPRMKVDAYLQWPIFGEKLQEHGMTGFAQMTVDSNPRKGGADSVQSYFGINFDLRSLF